MGAQAGLFRESNPGPPAPEAGIIPLDQTADDEEFGAAHIPEVLLTR